MNQRYRNESTGGFHGDELRDRERAMRGREYGDYRDDRDDRFAREAASARDWDQRDLGTRGGEYADYGSYGDHGFGQGAGGRAFREAGYGGEDYRWGGQRDYSADQRPRGSVNQRDFGGGQGHGSAANYGGGYGGGEGYRQPQMGGQRPSRPPYGPAASRSREQGFGGRNYWGQQAGQPYGGQRGAQYVDQSAGLSATQAGRGFRGIGPKGWRRSDDRLQEDICERLTDDPWVDASDVSVQVSGGVVTLEGSVDERRFKHRIEDMVEQCGGVTEIRNFLSVKSRDMDATSTTSAATRATSSARGATGTASGANATSGSPGGSTGKH